MLKIILIILKKTVSHKFMLRRAVLQCYIQVFLVRCYYSGVIFSSFEAFVQKKIFQLFPKLSAGNVIKPKVCCRIQMKTNYSHCYQYFVCNLTIVRLVVYHKIEHGLELIKFPGILQFTTPNLQLKCYEEMLVKKKV